MFMQLKNSRLLLTALVGGGGFLLAWAVIFSSESYLKAKAYIYTDQAVRSEFGATNYCILYAASLRNERARFGFYVLGEKKKSSITLSVSQEGGGWMIVRSDS